MIGRFNVAPPAFPDSLSEMVESHRAKTGQDYAAIALFGLWGTADCSPEVRLYASYQHLRASPEDGPAWLETARIHAEADDVPRALHILDELERLNRPGLYGGVYLEDTGIHRAHFLAGGGRIAEALPLYDELGAEHGETALYRYVRATLLHELERYAEAEEGYCEALAALDGLDEGDLDEEIDLDAVREAVERCRRAAGDGAAFSGERPFSLGLVADGYPPPIFD